MNKTPIPRIHSSSISDQIVTHFKEAFTNHDYKNGEKLPSVNDLAIQFGVSVSSIREALKKLEALELVEMIHGKGVFVRSAPMTWPSRFRSFSETVRESGHVPGAHVLALECVPANSRVAVQLGIGVGDEVFRLKRLRSSDDDLVAIEESFLPSNLVPDLDKIYNEPMSLYQVLELQYNIHLIMAIHTLEAVSLTEEDALILNANTGEPALRMVTVAYDHESRPIEFGYSIFRGDRYRYIVRVTR